MKGETYIGDFAAEAEVVNWRRNEAMLWTVLEQHSSQVVELASKSRYRVGKRGFVNGPGNGPRASRSASTSVRHGVVQQPKRPFWVKGPLHVTNQACHPLSLSSLKNRTALVSRP